MLFALLLCATICVSCHTSTCAVCVGICNTTIINCDFMGYCNLCITLFLYIYCVYIYSIICNSYTCIHFKSAVTFLLVYTGVCIGIGIGIGIGIINFFTFFLLLPCGPNALQNALNVHLLHNYIKHVKQQVLVHQTLYLK